MGIRMKLTKFPDSCDPNKMVQEESRRRFSICPCCGETRKHGSVLVNKLERGEKLRSDFLDGGIYRRYTVPYKGWYGPAKGDILGWFFPWRWHQWRIDEYKCYTCGAEWESDPYPTDLRNC